MFYKYFLLISPVTHICISLHKYIKNIKYETQNFKDNTL